MFLETVKKNIFVEGFYSILLYFENTIFSVKRSQRPSGFEREVGWKASDETTSEHPIRLSPASIFLPLSGPRRLLHRVLVLSTCVLRRENVIITAGHLFGTSIRDCRRVSAYIGWWSFFFFFHRGENFSPIFKFISFSPFFLLPYKNSSHEIQKSWQCHFDSSLANLIFPRN